ncbi:nitroreductase family protein [Pseudohalioglobus lutimaris]|uniref:Putative NAD(P)H nitroreductase n=1 Tax=Pseudohalioglobus lutimaris TaxID=1737061 RepID=A0A2N5WYI7_9GAMM|nr:nitroreductase [Pseudohalioglobus lutimaris]PLW67304.1 nitroreductase [Pseudohalioglobus lutimaris]
MNERIQFLQQRNSAARLTEPGPSAEELESMFSVAMRAPDHARLRPWRFLTISGARRNDLGALLREALLLREPDADIATLDKASCAPLRAPLIVAVITCFCEHPKVPPVEQRMSAACAAHGLLFAADALGYGAIWRTGKSAFDPHVQRGLGLEPGEEIAGFIYLGTRQGPPKPLPALQPADFVQSW